MAFPKSKQRESSLESAMAVLEKVFQEGKGSFSDEFLRLKLEKNWKAIVGTEFSRDAVPRKIYKSTLYLTAMSSEALYHFRFSEAIILERINKFLGQKKIEFISFTQKSSRAGKYSKGGKKFIEKSKMRDQEKSPIKKS